MLRGLPGLVMLCGCLLSTPAAADEPSDAPADPPPDAAPAPAPTPAPAPAPALEAAPATTQASVSVPAMPAAPFWASGWHTEVSGYFRAPMALGISKRPGPDDANGPRRMQVSYGPNRTIASSYYSFGYTRLQEQDWVEVLVHEKHKHVEGVVGWMGYWFQAVGFRNPDASWAPGVAYVTVDTDFTVGPVKPNIALTGGAWWPSFGAFPKYDTYTLGRFRQMGGQLKLTVRISRSPSYRASVPAGMAASIPRSHLFTERPWVSIYCIGSTSDSPTGTMSMSDFISAISGRPIPISCSNPSWVRSPTVQLATPT